MKLIISACISICVLALGLQTEAAEFHFDHEAILNMTGAHGLLSNLTELDKQKSINPDWIHKIQIGDGQKYDENGELTCIAFGKELMAMALPAFNECMKEMQLSIGKLRKKFMDVLPCMKKCVGIKMGFLLEDGTFNVAHTKKVFDEIVPKRFQKYVHRIWDSCYVFVEAIKPNDETCGSYKPLIKCFLQGFYEAADEILDMCPDIPDLLKRALKAGIQATKKRHNSAENSS